MLIYGKLVKVYEGREYKGNRPMVAQILDGNSSGRANIVDVQLEGSGRDLEAFLDQDVLVEFTEISGRGANGSYTLRVDGRVPGRRTLENLSTFMAVAA